MIEPKHPQLSIVKQFDLLCLNRSSIYYEPAKESEENLQILRCLDNRYQETLFTGARKLIKVLEKYGYKLNMKRLR
jgi:putative transposase